MRYSFIREHRKQFQVRRLCRLLQVSPSGYYAWEARPESARAQANRELTAHIHAFHTASRGTYGRRRIYLDVQEAGIRCSRNRIGRLMRLAGLQGRCPRRFCRTTDSHHAHPVAPHRLAQHEPVTAPNQVWVSDLTYLRTEEGWLYLATVMDLFSRRIVGWSMHDSLHASVALEALEMAVAQRQPAPGLLHHSDRGVQYACGDYQAALQNRRMVCSMSGKGHPWDNAAQESFFGRLKVELPRDRWPSRAAARGEVFEHLEVFYNRHRRHSSLNYLSPVAFEERFMRQAA